MVRKSSLLEDRKATSRLSHIKKEERDKEMDFGERSFSFWDFEHFLSDQDFWAGRELLDPEVKGYN